MMGVQLVLSACWLLAPEHCLEAVALSPCAERHLLLEMRCRCCH